NILYPETETITSTVTFDAGRLVTITQAWDFVVMILEQAGFTLVLRGNGIYTLITNTKAFNEPLPLYIGVDYNQLPDSVERIRYIYYFNSIQASKQKAELTTILTNIVSAESLKNIKFEDSTNAMILTDRSDMVKTVMQLISILDESGFQEAVDVMALEYVKSSEVAAILKSLTATDDKNKPNKSSVSLSSGQRSRLFSEYVRIESLEAKDSKSSRPLNSIVIMGKTQDIEEIKKFIKKYLDIPLESGQSFYHVVDLQWLNAIAFEPILKAFLSGGGGGQSSSTLSSDLAFDAQIKVVAEAIKQGSATGSAVQTASAGATSTANTSQTAMPNVVQRGGNKLIIACSSKDWTRIDALIKQLDIPQKQVIIEALVMDLDLAFTRQLGAQIRTRGLEPTIFPSTMQAQAGLLINNIIATGASCSATGNPDTYTLTGDLSDILNPAGVYSNSASSTSISNPASPCLTGSSGAADGVNGSTVFMINGGKARTNGVWAFFQLLSTHQSSKVFTRPVLMVQNNQQASVNSTVTKTLAGAVSGTVNPTVNYQQQSAPVSITFTPLISENNTVNLQIGVTLQTWVSVDDAASGTQTVRTLNTNVSMKNGDLLILGGLISDSTTVSKRSVPFFERIPVIGNLFASRKKLITKDQLYILLRVTVVEPRTNVGMGAETRAAADFMIDQLAQTEETFDNLKDPITRWFFNSDRKQSAAEYMEEKISELPAFDLGRSGDNIELDDRVVHLPRKTGDDMKVGWFSNAPSNSKFASKSSTSGDMDSLSRFLKDLENPFEKRLQV
ncbi:MAG: hypothetical protein NTU89_01785, partial [Candidatus Dependentiae bacterium]|nr:hypothetical protein [Candidatus Dependentiae bacterium]